ncbi:MAG: GNAT family N-acetyltransferase [Candidatus Hermodarchaeota archaeon]
MSLESNPLNFKKNISIWMTLIRKLDRKLNTSTKLIFPEVWNIKYYMWFHDIEANAFRESLRYSYEEVEKRLHNPNVLFLYIMVNNEPRALLLGYLLVNGPEKKFFLDTIAVKNQGKGIGSIILKYVIKWLKKEGYKLICLDTEEIDEKKILLRKFYERLGFILKESDIKGNLSMELTL